MVDAFFVSVLRSFAIPIIAYIVLKDSPLGDYYSFFAVAITLTIVNVISIAVLVLRLIPNTIMFRAKRMERLFVRILLELSSIIVFWAYFYSNF